MNVVLIILMMILSVFLISISQHLFDKKGIIYIYLIYNILSFLLSFKIIEILGININSNIILSSLITSITYLIIEKLSVNEYKSFIKEVFIINTIVSILLLISALYIGEVNDAISINMQNLILDNYKILISYPIVTLICNSLILLIYRFITDVTENISIKIILSNLTVLMIETILFIIFSYIFKIKITTLLIIIVSNYLIKVLMSVIFTPLISYLIKLKKVKL